MTGLRRAVLFNIQVVGRMTGHSEVGAAEPDGSEVGVGEITNDKRASVQ